MPAKPPIVIPVGKSVGINLTEEQLDRVESAYKTRLSSVVRHKIRRVTAAFTAEMSAKKDAIKLRDLQKRLQQLESIAKPLREKLGSEHLRRHMQSVARTQRIAKKLNFAPERVYYLGDDAILTKLTVALDTVLEACESAKELSGSVHQIEWDAWVFDLHSIMEGGRLPSGVNKSTDAEPSQFVLLIQALQCEIPMEFWRQQRAMTTDTLATAIVRAKKSVEVIKLPSQKVRGGEA